MSGSETIAVAMSGGVDSSAVAALLQRAGHTVVGLTLQLWNQKRLAGRPGMPEQVEGRCCSLEDVHDARRVAETLGIPYYVINQQERFEREVVKNFVDEYLSGRTPVPCAHCNTGLKFDQLLRIARQIGAGRIATGHYARNEFNRETGCWELRRAADRDRDQTYFLFGLTQEQLAYTWFPLGGSVKPEVRQAAREHGLEVADKPDSQEICFVPGGDYKRFLEAYLDEQGRRMPDSSGELVTADGQVLGRHAGIHQFTVGQRKGLGIAAPGPFYVLQIDAGSRRVTVGGDHELARREMQVREVNWLAGSPPAAELEAEVKIRHRHPPAPATLRVRGDGRGRVEVEFREAQRAITPGQAAVFYQGEVVLGGGWIE